MIPPHQIIDKRSSGILDPRFQLLQRQEQLNTLHIPAGSRNVLIQLNFLTKAMMNQMFTEHNECIREDAHEQKKRHHHGPILDGEQCHPPPMLGVHWPQIGSTKVVAISVVAVATVAPKRMLIKVRIMTGHEHTLGDYHPCFGYDLYFNEHSLQCNCCN